jgi:DNA-binding PadR family transcriptional regulator
MFDADDLRLVMLQFMLDEPRHGYELIKLVEEAMGGAHAPSPGIVYPTLTMLEEMGLAEVAMDGTRKRYAITADGRKELQKHRATVDTVLQRMKHVGERVRRDRASPVVRAMENVKLVLRMRSETWTSEQREQVADILDEAARRIERLA